ncbi:hypothetical protein BRADI_3g47265v3 [Brachypodium distachyon]|uniref:Uncharacterized protein n=1 Tax=Brachypodium distachyon TaxID=15368 RepID=A0A2K2D3S7_BRADI|nr:hypothetical protein BRADI_3g47265v3 [Brachypodium distachyon]
MCLRVAPSQERTPAPPPHHSPVLPCPGPPPPRAASARPFPASPVTGGAPPRAAPHPLAAAHRRPPPPPPPFVPPLPLAADEREVKDERAGSVPHLDQRRASGLSFSAGGGGVAAASLCYLETIGPDEDKKPVLSWDDYKCPPRVGVRTAAFHSCWNFFLGSVAVTW